MSLSADSEDYYVLKKLSNGSVHAYEILFNRYWAKVYALCFSLVKNGDDAADITQNIFRTLWEKRCELKIHESLEAYIIRMAKNGVINHFRQKQTRIHHENFFLLANPPIPGRMEDALLFDRLERYMDDVVSQLSQHCQSVFLLQQKDGLTNQEIADRLGLSTKTVEYHLNRARRFLKERLRHAEFFLS